MKIYLYNLWIFHSSLYCTVPFCPSMLCLHNCHLEGVHRVTWERESVCVACVSRGRKVSLGFCSVTSRIISVVSAVHVFHLCWPTISGVDYSERLVFFFSLFFLIRTQLVETAKNICFGTDLHCSDVHSFLSMAMIVTTNTSDPLW